MADLVEIAKVKVEEKYLELSARLKEERDLKQALTELETKKDEVIKQLQTLAGLKAPTDLIDFYVKTGGKVWVSKRVFLRGIEREVNVTVRSTNLAAYEAPIQLPKGLYRLILMAIPEEAHPDRLGNEVDDYGYGFQVGK